jgi:hypothetical protein
MDMRPVEGGDTPRVPLANIAVNAADIVEERERVEMAAKLVQSGYDPTAVLAALGLPAMPHSGLASNQLQPAENAQV